MFNLSGSSIKVGQLQFSRTKIGIEFEISSFILQLVIM